MAAAAGLAAGFLGPAIDLAKLVAKPIVRQFNYLCCFTSNIKSLSVEFKKLNDETEELEEKVERERNNVQEPVRAVQSWLDDSNKINDEINGILNEATNVGTGCLKLGARFSLSKKAKKTTDRTKELRGEKPEAEFKPGPIAAIQGVQLEKTFECESRKKIEEDIITTLRDGDVNMIGICGMGGLGKTTMAKKIMNRVLEEHVFEEVVIATVSQNVDISKIQDDIGGQLGLEKLKEERSQPARVQILHSRLSDAKRILLVLDDVWGRLVLEDFGIPRDSKGCTILLTSRNSDVLRDMDVRIFGMEVLSEEEAWSFFRERAGTCVDDRELNPIAKEVAKECGGLPIALAVVGRVLKQQRNLRNWKNALQELKQLVPDTVRFDKEVYNPLKLSYNRLDSKLAQSLFLLCCLFREDADIPLEYLTNFCMGLGIFEGIINMEDARNKTCALTELLKDRSLLLESDGEDCVRMHDVVRDVCTFIAKEEGYIGKDGCTWISSSHLIGSRCPNLRLFFLDCRYDNSLGFKFDDAFLEGMRELYVLCIERYSLTTLPHPRQSLGKLNTLILVACDELETISVVGELVNLEVLICRYCHSIKKLPSEMKGLNRLKLLELTGCRQLKSIGRGIISSLVGLEELKMRWSFNGWEAEDREERENAAITELEALTNLACLEIDIKDPSLFTENMPLLSKKIVRFIIRTDDSDFPSKFSKAMSLCLERETRLGDWMMHFFRDTECLSLEGEGANNVDLARSQNIRWLELGECKSMKNVVRTSGGDDATVFPSIEHLKLYYLDQLEEICDGPISSTSFQNLNELELMYLNALTQFWKSSSVCQNNYVPPLFKNLSSIHIWYCNSLRNLGQLSMAGKDCLPQLKQLYIGDCEMMEQVFLWNDENKTSIESQRNCHVITKVFPKLKEVTLYDLPNLTIFYQGIQGIEFPLLTEMKIIECPKMKSIIGSSSADIDEDGSLHLLCQPRKISLGSSLKVLEINHNPFCGHEIPSSVFNGLEELRINKYVGSMSLFTLSMAANLVSLRELRIEYCDEMVKVIEDEQQVASGGQRILLFPKLEKLYMEDLPNLVRFCEWKCDVELPSLTKVEIYKCPNMENFSMGLVAAPNLKIVKIDYKGIYATKDLNGAVQQHYLARREKLESERESLPAMITGVWSNDAALQLEATTQFRKLLSIERNTAIEEVIQSGVVPRFVEFLARDDYPQLQFEAAWALTNIACGTSENTKVVIDHNAIPIFVRLLSSTSDDVREQAVWALGNVAGDSPKCRDLVLSYGALAPLLAQFSDQAKLSMLRNATWTLSNFCRGKPQPQFEQVKPALTALTQLICTTDEEVLTDACRALSYLSDGTNDKIQAVIEAGVCPRLLELLLHPSPSVLIPALRTVGNIVMGDDLQIKFLVREGCIKPLCDLLICPDPRIVTVCLEGLENILKVGEAEKNQGNSGDVNVFAQMIDDAEGLEKIENLQSHDNNEIYEKAVKILETYLKLHKRASVAFNTILSL